MQIKHAGRKPAKLVLQDGSVINGCAIGKTGTTGGEICFNTGMTGYQEIYTDPSYFGQIIINTVAHVGNYGVATAEQESATVKFAGLVCDRFSDVYSRHSAYNSLQGYLESAGIVGISDVDTRRLVRHVRSKGAMNALISSEELDEARLFEQLAALPDMNHLELSSKVSTPTAYMAGAADGDLRVAVLDLGIKQSIINELGQRGLKLQIFPAKTPFSEMEKFAPHGYFISNGPGDPSAMPYAVETVKQVLAHNRPLFGICMGHQILALANDVPTYKMHHGHRGLNHPVKNLITGLGEITSQNHGFAVSAEVLASRNDVQVTHINLNDNTVEGLRTVGKPAFSVQYHPESSPGPRDSLYLFDQFKQLITENRPQ